jgi:hypothetical protein
MKTADINNKYIVVPNAPKEGKVTSVLLSASVFKP